MSHCYQRYARKHYCMYLLRLIERTTVLLVNANSINQQTLAHLEKQQQNLKIILCFVFCKVIAKKLLCSDSNQRKCINNKWGY